MFHRKTPFAYFAILLAGCVFAEARAAEAPKVEYLCDALLGRVVSATQGWGEIGLDTAAFAIRESALKLRIKDKNYAHGIGHHANGEIVVNLGGQFKTFETEIGVQWQGGGTPGSVIFQIYVDDKKVLDSGVVRENDSPRPVNLSVEGADELRLVVIDAGDGITCDAADWADARLTRNPVAAKESPDSSVDIAPFGRIAAWDPKVMSGTKASRVQEMPGEDICTYKELLPTANGTYNVPVQRDTGCIGVQWDENRLLRRLELQFFNAAAVPNIASVRLELWAGESAWQGNWQRQDIVAEKAGNRLTWTLGLQTFPQGTQKARWVFSDVRQPLEVAAISAFSRSRWKTVDVRLESTDPGSAKKSEIGIVNGVFVSPTETTTAPVVWDTSHPLLLKVRCSTAAHYKADRTVLQLRLPETAFGVAVEDLVANDCVFVPHAGVFATREPAAVKLEDYLQKTAGRSSVLAEVRQKPDQDFSQAWAAVHRPVEDIMPTMVSLACDNRKYVVHRNGTLDFEQYDGPEGPEPPVSTVGVPGPSKWQLQSHFGSGQNLQLSRQLHGDWLPMPVTTAKDNNVTYDQLTCVAPASEAQGNQPAWLRDRAVCAVEYAVKNAGTETVDARLALNFAAVREPKQVVQFQEVEEGILATSADRVLALIDTREARSLALKREGEGLVLSGRLPRGAEARCAVCLPGWKVAPADYAVLAKGDPWSERAETYWKTLFAPAMQIDVPDALLTNIIRASQACCAVAARNEKRGAYVAPWIAATYYGPLESEAQAIVRGMDMNGHPDFTRRSIEFFLAKCNAAGFITTGYTLIGTGELLWTLGEHYDRTHDRAWLKKVAPDVVRICQWIIRQRAKTKRLDARGQKLPEFGLMPPGVSADWNRFAYRFFNDAQYYAALEASGRILADISDPAAAAIQDDAKQYREDIERAFRWAQARTPVVPLANGTWVPGDPSLLDCPGRVEDFLPGEDAGRTWCYSIEAGAHHLPANRVLDPASRETAWMADYLEDVQFLRSGWGEYTVEEIRKDVFNLGGFAKLQPYYCRIAELYALRDDVKPFIRTFFNTIPSLVNAENLSFCEHFHNWGAWNKTHETGWFLCQARLMFVQERGDELWLAPFVTTHWLEDGKKISVRNAPTRFGKVGYAIESAAAKGKIEAVVELPPQCTARKIVLRLRHPEGKPMQSVTVHGKPHQDFDPKKETITFEPVAGKITIQAQY